MPWRHACSVRRGARLLCTVQHCARQHWRGMAGTRTSISCRSVRWSSRHGRLALPHRAAPPQPRGRPRFCPSSSALFSSLSFSAIWSAMGAAHEPGSNRSGNRHRTAAAGRAEPKRGAGVATARAAGADDRADDLRGGHAGRDQAPAGGRVHVPRMEAAQGPAVRCAHRQPQRITAPCSDACGGVCCTAPHSYAGGAWQYSRS